MDTSDSLTPMPQNPPNQAPLEQAAAPLPVAPEYKDRSTGLVVFGVFQIVLGCFALLGIPLLFLSVLLARKSVGTLPFGGYVMTAATYALAAAALITLGVGSIRARRWAWALTLVSSWIWLLVGAVSTVVMVVVVPAGFMANMRAASGGNPDMPAMSRGFIAVILTLVIVFFTFVLVIIPIAFLVFYRRKDVEATCKRRDPVPRWTERSPLPVLAVSMIFALGAAYYFLLSFTTPLIPGFGRYLTGLPGAAACLVIVALDIYLAISLFRLKLLAWWIAFAAILLRVVSVVFTQGRDSVLAAYSRMGWSQQQLNIVSQNPALRPGVMIWITLALSLPMLGYLLWIKHYFRAASLAPSDRDSGV